jgi:hypothetical protein
MVFNLRALVNELLQIIQAEHSLPKVVSRGKFRPPLSCLKNSGMSRFAGISLWKRDSGAQQDIPLYWILRGCGRSVTDSARNKAPDLSAKEMKGKTSPEEKPVILSWQFND